VDLAYFDYPLQALWFSCSPPSDIGGLAYFEYLREERKTIKGTEDDRKKRLRPPMSDGGEEEDQRT
jgi:hypothetical protein